MASLREIKKKIKSAKNIGQVTKALQMVSAVKMRKSQLAALQSKPYAEEVTNALIALNVFKSDGNNPLLSPPKNPSAPIVLVIMAPDKGLAGPLVTNLLRETLSFVSSQTMPVQAIVWGKKAASIAVKCGLQVIADVTPQTDQPANVQVALLARLLVQAFKDGSASQVYLVYSRFVSTLVQLAQTTKFLPIEISSQYSRSSQIIAFEPSPDRVQEFIVRQYIEVKLGQMVKESVAAEHSARMVAMKKASDNARDIVSDYQLAYNKTRQEKITGEIADLTANMIL